MRRLPPRSEPVASHTWRVASATAEPPDEPPQVRLVSHGFGVRPNTSLKVLRAGPELGRVRLGDDDRPALLQPLDHDVGALGDVVGVDRRAVGRADACDVVQILHGNWQPRERQLAGDRRRAFAAPARRRGWAARSAGRRRPRSAGAPPRPARAGRPRRPGAPTRPRGPRAWSDRRTLPRRLRGGTRRPRRLACMFLDDPPQTPQATATYDAAREGDGYVANFARLWCWRPDLFKSFVDLRLALMGSTTLSDREQAIVVTSTVSQFGDSYCSLAWGSKLAKLADAETAGGIIAGEVPEELSAREAALCALVPDGRARPDDDDGRAGRRPAGRGLRRPRDLRGHAPSRACGSPSRP